MPPSSRTKALVVFLLPVLDYGGAETCALLYARHADRERFDLRVCTFWKNGHIADEVRSLGVPVDVLGIDPAVRNPAALVALTRYLRRQRPDILHTNVGEANFHGGIAGALARVPHRVAHAHGTPARSQIGRVAFGAVFRTFDLVLGCSNAVRDYLVEQESVDRSRIEVVLNPPLDENFDIEHRPSEDGRFRILTVGRLVPEKNHSGLLDVISDLVQTDPEVHLSIAGTGPLEDALEDRIEVLGLNDHVDLLGFRDDVPQLLSETDLFVLPSVSEGYGIVLAEAMAAGIPVIGSTAGGIPEVMGAGAEKWILPATATDRWVDTIRDVVRMTDEERRSLGARWRREAVERLSPDSFARQIEAIYDRLLGV